MAMGDISYHKKVVEHKLSRDEARLTELRENLDRSEQLSSAMVSILESFQGRLNKLDNTIMPVYRQTKRLTCLQENVDKTLTALERVIGYHHVVDEVEPIIKDGPDGNNVDLYLKQLDRLRVAVDFFTHNNPNSVELSHVNLCFEGGLDRLEVEFRKQLREHSSKPIFPALLQKVASADSVESAPELKHIPDDVVKTLNTLATYLVNTGVRSEQVTQTYTHIRSTALGRSLRSLKEGSQGPIIGPSSRKGGSVLRVGDSPAKKPTKRMIDASSKMTRRDIVQGTRSTKSLLEGAGTSEQVEGSALLISSATVLLRLMESEWHLMERIVPSQHHLHVFGSLISQPVDYFKHEAEAVLQRVQRKVSHQEYAAVVPCLKIIKHLYGLLPELQRVMADLEGPSFQKFTLLVVMADRIALKGMEDFIQYVKGDSEKQSNLPKDGTVHELTSGTMWFLEQLLDYSDTMGRLHLSQGEYSVFEDEDSARQKAVGSYFVKVLSALTLNMEGKARAYESGVLSAVFLMNNYCFIQETYTRCKSMLPLLELALPDIEDHYNTSIDSQQRTYQRGFSKLLSFLSMSTVATQPSKHQRQMLKDKFKGFNTELEELYRVQQQYSIPNARLRARLRDDNVNIIAPIYTEFYKQYAQVNFTKNREKYIKYQPKEVESKLGQFFDLGAH